MAPKFCSGLCPPAPVPASASVGFASWRGGGTWHCYGECTVHKVTPHLSTSDFVFPLDEHFFRFWLGVFGLCVCCESTQPPPPPPPAPMAKHIL